MNTSLVYLVQKTSGASCFKAAGVEGEFRTKAAAARAARKAGLAPTLKSFDYTRRETVELPYDEALAFRAAQ
jgi:hypothetical protein